MSLRVSKILNHLQDDMRVYRYGVFIAGPLPQNIVDVEGETLFDMYRNFFTRNKDINHKNEEWIRYDVTKYEFPTHKELLKLSGIIITGSLADSFDNKIKWVLNLRKLIKEIVNNSIYSHIKLIGICFGHQIIAHSLNGGKSFINPLKKNIENNWEIGVKKIEFNQNFYKIFPNFDKNIKSLNVVEHHRDAVISIPNNAILLASSKWTKNELYIISDRVLSFQGHPEFKPYVIEIITKWQYQKLNILDKSTYDSAIKSLQTFPDNDDWSKLLGQWLRR